MMRNLRSPWLDEFRGSLPSRRTSELLTWIAHPHTVDRGPDGQATDASLILAAALVAICDELDVRIPPRE